MNIKRLLKGKGIRFLVIIEMVIIIAIIYWWPKRTPLDEIQIHFINVKLGDSILIDFGLNEVLIDGGGLEPGITDYISEYVDGVLEVMVMTHPHVDHFGGLIKVLEVFPVGEIWLNGDSSTTEDYQDFMTAVESEKAEVNQAKRNGTISIGGLNFSILNPPDPLFNDTNENSIVLRLKYGDIGFLFTGDAVGEANASMLAVGGKLQAQILKVGHHCGERTSFSKQFLEKVKPETAICMVEHEGPMDLKELEEIGAEIYRTDIDGTIVVSTDGRGYKIKTNKTQEAADYSLPYPGVLPDHPLYWVKMIRDRVSLWLTIKPLAKTEKLLLYADKQLVAGWTLIERNKVELALTTLAKGEKYLKKVMVETAKLGEERDEIRFKKKLSKALMKRGEVMLLVKEKLGDEYKEVIEQDR